MRHDDWEYRLSQYARTVLGRPMDWGATDCGSLVRDAVAWMYTDPPLDIPPYLGVRGAQRALASIGDIGDHLEGVGAEKRSVAFAQIGDILYRAGPDDDGFPVLGVCFGAKALVVTKDDGVCLRPMETVPTETEAWRLPHG